ncbi:MAG: mandelate racemase/muconate lactonizing enzyme family protein [Roseiflexaceae bacterium]
MKITDLKCAVIGGFPVVRITTDAGIDGIGQAENWKPNLKPHILYYRDMILGLDPTNVEAVMQRIRRMGSFKPWGAAVSAIEIALWDIAGKAANLPIYKLLGGKVRDKVRVYNGAIRFPLRDQSPAAYAEDVLKMAASPEGFSLIKQGIAFHSRMPNDIPGYYTGDPRAWGRHPHRGMLSAAGFRHTVACVEAMRNALPAHIELALDCGPGFLPPDAVRLAQAVEGMGIAWLEDMLTGDYVPYVSAAQYRDVKAKTSTPIHTGEQIYLRQNFMELIETHAVDVIGPDPLDVGGIAELKWITEYADIHGIAMAPHGTGDGIFGLAALVQVCATLPDNYIAFEYPLARPEWWYDIVDGLPDVIVKDSYIDVWDRPGLGVTFNKNAQKYLLDEDKGFFDL